MQTLSLVTPLKLNRKWVVTVIKFSPSSTSNCPRQLFSISRMFFIYHKITNIQEKPRKRNQTKNRIFQSLVMLSFIFFYFLLCYGFFFPFSGDDSVLSWLSHKHIDHTVSETFNVVASKTTNKGQRTMVTGLVGMMIMMLKMMMMAIIKILYGIHNIY